MPNVLILGGTEDNDFFQVCAHEGTSPIQHMIHQPLESGWLPLQAKQHIFILEQSLKGCVGPGLLSHWHLPVACTHVQGRNEMRLSKVIDEVFQHRHGICINVGLSLYLEEVNAEMHAVRDDSPQLLLLFWVEMCNVNLSCCMA